MAAPRAYPGLRSSASAMMDREPPLRVGLVGAGMVSAHHLTAWAKIPEARVIAVADRDLERAEASGLDAVFESAEEMIAATSPDALDIAAPVGIHGDLCRLAADRGIAILCQKPLAGTLEEAARIVDDIGTRVRFMVHENWRFRPTYRRIKTWLDEDLIGTVCIVRLRVESSGLVADQVGVRPALVRQPFLAALPRCLVFEVLIHHLDVLRWLLGDLTVAAARLTCVSGAVQGEDAAAVMLDGEGRVPVSIDACLAVPGAPRHIFDHLEIVGSRGVIRLSDTSLSLAGLETAQHRWDFETLYAASFEGAVREFATGIRCNRPFESEARENLETLRLVEAVYAAADWPQTT